MAGRMAASFFTSAEMIQHAQASEALDVPPLLCDICQARTKHCKKCVQLKKPVSAKELFEHNLIVSPMKFDKQAGKVTTKYLPVIDQSFHETFPPELSNKHDAEAIARKTLKQLQKNCG